MLNYSIPHLYVSDYTLIFRDVLEQREKVQNNLYILTKLYYMRLKPTNVGSNLITVCDISQLPLLKLMQ